MLAEFLFTPDVMADVETGNGIDIVSELTSCLFPRTSTPVALVCKLGDEEWELATSQRITRIANPNRRQAAMSLFQKLLSDSCVTRPAIGRDGDTEQYWVDAGIKSSAAVPLNNIVVSRKCIPPNPLGVALQNFVHPDFWDSYANPRLVRRDSTAQADVLRVVCTHSDWLLLRLPQIRGGCDDEIVTAKQVIKLASQLPPGFRKSEIDLHICPPGRIPQNNVLNSIRGELQQFVRQGVKIEVTLWPERHFINRELIAGEHAKVSSGAMVRKPLWFITMAHVAVGGRTATAAGDSGNTWSLFSRQKAYTRCEEIAAEKPLNRLSLHA